jgi:hypothetical protein
VAVCVGLGVGPTIVRRVDGRTRVNTHSSL